eukprot:6761656-Alexandrium_andersonii.AAC.1
MAEQRAEAFLQRAEEAERSAGRLPLRAKGGAFGIRAGCDPRRAEAQAQETFAHAMQNSGQA